MNAPEQRGLLTTLRPEVPLGSRLPLLTPGRWLAEIGPEIRLRIVVDNAVRMLALQS